MRKLNVAASIASFLMSCVGILTWFNVTPEMVGESVYAIISAVVPFVTLIGGGFFGWGIASIRCRRRVDRSAEEARRAEDSARSLERFKADAEPKLERLAEIENEYDLRRFSKVQLKYMLLCLCEESAGGVGIKKEWGDPVADSLVVAGVFLKASAFAGSLEDIYSLAPEWRRFVSANEDEVRSMVGGDGVPAAPSTL